VPDVQCDEAAERPLASWHWRHQLGGRALAREVAKLAIRGPGQLLQEPQGLESNQAQKHTATTLGADVAVMLLQKKGGDSTWLL